MIVRPVGEQIRLITQHDHARAAGSIARRWRGADRIPSVLSGLRDRIFFAVDNHDVGWCEADVSPRLDPETKLPLSFFNVTPDETIDLWVKGIDFCSDFSPFSGYLVSRHFAALAETGIRGAPADELVALQRFVDEEAGRQERLLTELEPEEERAKEDAVLLLRTCDTLSLLACRAPEITPEQGETRPLARSGLRVRVVGDEGLEVTPWPFEGEAFVLKFPGSWIPRRSFDAELDLLEALANAEPLLYESLIAPLRGNG